MKLFYTVILFTSMSFSALAQMGIHKGDMFENDSLKIEIVYPPKMSSFFQVYFYDRGNKALETITNGNINFFFSKDNSDFITAKLVKKDGVWTVTLEDWKEFHHAKLQYEVNGNKHHLEFWNRKYSNSPPVQSQKNDGHAGHSH